MRNPLLLIDSFVLRDLWRNKIRTLLTIAGIALGVAVMLAINLANGTAFSRFQENIDLVAGKANLEIVPTGQPQLDEHVLGQLTQLWKENAKFTPVIDQRALMPGEKPDVVEVLGVDMFADPSFRPFSTSSGIQTDANDAIFNEGVAYVGERFAQRYALKIGKPFHLLVNDKEKELRVGGILSYNGPGKAFGGNLLVMDIGPAQVLFDMPGKIDRIDIIADESKVSDITKSLTKRLPGSVTVERPSRRGAQVEKMIAAFQYNLTALSLIALLVGMFLIYNTMSMSVVRKRRELGILRTIGTSTRRIVWIFLSEALFLGATGAAAGVGLGLLFARGAVRAVGATIQSLYADQPPADVTFSTTVLAIAFVVGLVLTVVAAIPPIIEAMTVSPAEASRRASYEIRAAKGTGALAIVGVLLLLAAAVFAVLPSVAGFPVFGYTSAALTIFGAAFCTPIILSGAIKSLTKIATSLFGSEGKLALLSLGGTLGRTSVAVASLMIGISMMVSLAIMIGSFRDTVIVWVNQSLRADLYVAPEAREGSKRMGKLSTDVVSSIQAIHGVEDVDAFVEFPIVFNGNPANLGSGDLDVMMRHGRLMLVGGENAQSVFAKLQQEDGAVVTESFSLKNHVHQGDLLTLQSPSGPFTIKVEGIYYDYASDAGYIVLPRRVFRKHFDDTYSSTLGVYLKPNANVDAVRNSMLRALGTNVRVNIRTNGELRQEVLRIFDNTFSITYALHTISIIVAILSVMNALFAMTFDMRRDFAILNYIGASMRQLRKIVLVQAGALGLLGNVAGIVVGFVLSLLLINVINKQSFGWTIQFALPTAFLVQSFLLVMAFSLLSGILPARASTESISPEEVRIE